MCEVSTPAHQLPRFRSKTTKHQTLIKDKRPSLKPWKANDRVQLLFDTSAPSSTAALFVSAVSNGIYLSIYIYMVSACRLVQLQNSSSDIVKDLRSETPHPENSICWGCARSKIRFQKQYNKQLYANLAQLGQLDIPSKQDGKETV